MSKLFRLALENKHNNPKTLTDSSTPKELLEWMNKNLSYHGVNKKHLFTPEEVIELKKGHCWETADFTYHELSLMELKCFLLYLEDEGCQHTHTALFYQDNDKYYWFEWAWGQHEGIHGPFKSNDEVIELIAKKFKDQYHSLVIAVMGHGRIKSDMNEEDYIHMTNNWKNVLPKNL